MTQRLTIALACFALLLTVGCASEPDTAAPPAGVEADTCGSVRNLHRAGDIYLAGQPGKDDFALLKERGVKTIINLRPQAEHDLDEQRIVEDLGITYVHIPWNGPDQLTDARLDAMRTALRESERPLMLHCASANRVGPAWLAYRVLDAGVPVEQATREAKQIGMSTPAYETKALAYIEARR